MADLKGSGKSTNEGVGRRKGAAGNEIEEKRQKEEKLEELLWLK